jgi:hypothetical protein
LIDERAAVRGVSQDQLDRAKRKMSIIPFKEQKFGGGWFWCLPQHHPTPSHLSTAELTAYRNARDALLAEIGAELGRNIVVLEI